MQTKFGSLLGSSATEFRLWAPSASEVLLSLSDSRTFSLKINDNGFWSVSVQDCPAGTRYKFRIRDLEFPDPASRQQDGGTAGWSVVVAPLAPSERSEPIRPWHETVICEVHVGTATPEGTFLGLTKKLEHYRDAGYTALEIMPINMFPGTRNWGYDGTLIFAPAEAYGTREELRGMVDHAHELGLCLILDVVYNHFGEFDNFIERYAPEWFDSDIETPWGPGIDFSREMVRQFYYENARMWLSEFDFDGLRFDAVHEMKTNCRDTFLGDLAKSARGVKSHAKLIIENMNNNKIWLKRTTDNEPVNFTAQWNDDIHHVLNYLATGNSKAGYGNKDKDPIADLEKALVEGFIHSTEGGSPRDGGNDLCPDSAVPPDCFVSYAQNHDQIGNRADSRRLPDRISAEKLDFLQFVMLLAPNVPLFFMGDEAHLQTPFPYFFDLPEAAAAPKRDDRYRQMNELFDETVEEGGLPDPNEPATFEMAKLDWSCLGQPEPRAAVERFRILAAWRRDMVWPLAATAFKDAHSGRQGTAIVVSWIFEGGTLTMALNPSDMPCDLACTLSDMPVTTGSYNVHGDVLRLGPWGALAWVWRPDH